MHRVCRLDEITEGRAFQANVDDEDIVLVREGDKVYALKDNCSHQDFPLSLGQVSPGRIKCAAHGSEFDLATGRAINAPAFAPVETYPIKIEGGDVYVDVG
jgi:3-phenylpropionate/trans-cinnamate dioxygenase ferredoxin subunit